MANEENLMPIAEVNSRRTREEHSRDSQKAGIASGVARRRKRSMKDAVDLCLSLPEMDKRTVNAMLRAQIDPEDIDNQMSIVVALTKAAKRGNVQAAALLLKILGEDAPQEDAAADQLERARELLGGVESAID